VVDEMVKSKWRFWVLLGLSSLLAGGCENENKERVLRLGHGLDRSHPVHKAMEYMANRLAERSEGAIRLDIIPNAELGSEQELIEKARSGDLAMVKASAANLERFDPVMGVFGFPYLFSDSEHYWKVLNGPIGKEILLSAESAGLIGLCFYDAGGRSFYTTTEKIDHPADLEGLRIRIIDSPTSMEMIRVLGAEPAPLAFGDLYSALQEGIVEGAENNPPSFYTSRHYEICPYYSLDEHTMIPDVLLISAKDWEALPSELRIMVKESAEESSRYQRELWTEETKEKLELLIKQGVEIIRPDKAPFQQATQTMYADYKGAPLGELIDSIRNLQ
jgi:tripartite ATP-independent transporter DctP family solute receptor